LRASFTARGDVGDWARSASFTRIQRCWPALGDGRSGGELPRGRRRVLRAQAAVVLREQAAGVLREQAAVVLREQAAGVLRE